MADLARLVVRGSAANVVAALRAPDTRMGIAAQLWDAMTNGGTVGTSRLRQLLRAGLLEACLSPALFEHPRCILDAAPDGGEPRPGGIEERLAELLFLLASNILVERHWPDSDELSALKQQAAPLLGPGPLRLFSHETNPEEKLWGSHDAWLAAHHLFVGLLSNIITHPLSKRCLLDAAGSCGQLPAQQLLVYSLVVRGACAPPPRARSWGGQVRELGGRRLGLWLPSAPAKALMELVDDDLAAVKAVGLTALPSPPPSCAAEALVSVIVGAVASAPDALAYLAWAFMRFKCVPELRPRLGEFEGLAALTGAYLGWRSGRVARGLPPCEWAAPSMHLPGMVSQTLQEGLEASACADARGSVVVKAGLADALLEDAAWLFGREGMAQAMASGVVGPSEVADTGNGISCVLRLLARGSTQKATARQLGKRLPQLRAGLAALERLPARSPHRDSLLASARTIVGRVEQRAGGAARSAAAAGGGGGDDGGGGGGGGSGGRLKNRQICRRCMKEVPAAGKRCSRCGARYCSKECQVEDWKHFGHKQECKLLQAHTQRQGAGAGCSANEKLLKRGRDLSQAGTAALFDRLPAVVAQVLLRGWALEECVVIAELLEGTEVYPVTRAEFLRKMCEDGESTSESTAHTEAVLARNGAAQDRLTCAVFGFDPDACAGRGEQRVILKTLPLPQEYVAAGITRWNEAAAMAGGLVEAVRAKTLARDLPKVLEQLKKNGMDQKQWMGSESMD
jgi:hypothetical protein